MARLAALIAGRAQKLRRSALLREHAGLVSVPEVFDLTDAMRWLQRTAHNADRCLFYAALGATTRWSARSPSGCLGMRLGAPGPVIRDPLKSFAASCRHAFGGLESQRAGCGAAAHPAPDGRLQAGLQLGDDGIAHFAGAYRLHALLAEQVGGAQAIGQHVLDGFFQPVGLRRPGRRNSAAPWRS